MSFRLIDAPQRPDPETCDHDWQAVRVIEGVRDNPQPGDKVTIYETNTQACRHCHTMRTTPNPEQRDTP